MGVILDTSVLIDAERKGLTVGGLLRNVQAKFGLEELALATVSVAEFEHGIWRARDEGRKQRRQEFLEELLAAVPPYPLTVTVARKVGRMDAECKKNGNAVAFQDLVIGATALRSVTAS
jgi:predicted nucleic acid-binding protein